MCEPSPATYALVSSKPSHARCGRPFANSNGHHAQEAVAMGNCGAGGEHRGRQEPCGKLSSLDTDSCDSHRRACRCRSTFVVRCMRAIFDSLEFLVADLLVAEQA